MNLKTKKPFFIVFEGLDGSGKTSSAKLVAELMGAKYMTTPSEPVRECRDDIIKSFNGCQEAAHMFYLSTVIAASEEIKLLLLEGTSVVLDRYLLSTQAYAEFRGSCLEIESEVEKVLLPADATVFLDASLKLRRSRLESRGATIADMETLDEVANAELLKQYIQREKNKVVGRFLRIDSSIGSIEEIACDIIKKLQIC